MTQSDQDPIEHPDDWIASVRQNRLLATLSSSAISSLAADLKLVPMNEGQVLYQQGIVQDVVYFPISGIVAFVYVMQNGDTSEIGVAGNDGLVSLAAVYGASQATNRAVVQVRGRAWCMPAPVLRERLKTTPGFYDILNRYSLAFVAQVAQTSVCNRHHSVRQQLARWMLHSLDRIPEGPIQMTQDLIANMLGVRREVVSVEAAKLRDEGAFVYARGSISVLDRRVLEAATCECYGVVVAETARLLGDGAQRKP